MIEYTPKKEKSMINWLASLFGKQKHKKHIHLSKKQKEELVIDFTINKMSRKQIALKYDVTYTTTCRIINNAIRRVQ